MEGQKHTPMRGTSSVDGLFGIQLPSVAEVRRTN
jgi:hypothetical protein